MAMAKSFVRKSDLVLDQIYLHDHAVPVRLLQKSRVINPLDPNSKTYIMVEVVDPDTGIASSTPLYTKARAILMTWEKHLALKENMTVLKAYHRDLKEHLGLPNGVLSIRYLDDGNTLRPVVTIHDQKLGSVSVLKDKVDLLSSNVYHYALIPYEEMYKLHPEVHSPALLPVPEL
jgi:hypothetical protein